MRFRALAPGKLNLSLRLGPIRADGRHELVTVFQAVTLADELVLTTLTGPAADEVVCPGVDGHNLAAQALRELRTRGWDGPPVRIEIVKRVPVAAGMGGGSADAAATLRLADAVSSVPASSLAEIAAGLGADVPAQLEPGVALGTGAGEVVERLRSLAPHAYVIVAGPEPLATPAVFREADRLGLSRPVADLDAWKQRLRTALLAERVLPAELLSNDLEPAAVSLAPAVAATLERVWVGGADSALVCGSGPTVAGLFWGEDGARRAAAAAAGLGSMARVAAPVAAGFAAPSPV